MKKIHTFLNCLLYGLTFTQGRLFSGFLCLSVLTSVTQLFIPEKFLSSLNKEMRCIRCSAF